MSRLTPALLVALSALGIACGAATDDDHTPPPPGADGGVADAAPSDSGFPYDVVPALPAQPAAASEPVLLPCPAGWRTIARPGAPDVCDPWPASGYASCPPGQAHFPGTPGCAAIGTVCPSGEFADLGATALYVTASTTAASGDGSMGAPFTSITAAINSTPAGGTIVLGLGTFDEDFLIDRPVTLRGSCVAGTTVVSSSRAQDLGVVTVDAEVELTDLTIAGERIGVLVESGRLHGHDLAIAGARQTGVRVSGGLAILEDVIIRDTQASPDGMFGYGRGMEVRGGGRVEVARAVLENNREIGIALRDPVTEPHRFTGVAVVATQLESAANTGRALNIAESASAVFERAVFEDNHDVAIALSYGGMLELHDAVVRDTEVVASGQFGVGIAVNADSHAVGSRVWITHNRTAGFAVGSDPNEQSSIDFTDLLVEETEGDADGQFGRGIEVGYGADARLERVWIRGNRLHGLFVDGAGSTITATDAFSLETRAKAADGSSGWGASATNGSHLTLRRAVLDRNVSTAASFSGEGTEVILRDLIVEDTAPGVGVVGPCGRGLNAQEGVRLIVERARLFRNREVGIVIHDPTTLATLSDIRVEDTATVGLGVLGSGIGIQLGAHMTLDRAEVSDSRECGVFVHDQGATLIAKDLLVRDGRGTPQFGTFGRGLNVQTGGRIQGTRVLLEDNREAAAVVANAGSSLALSEVTIRGTRQRLCAATDCPNEGAGAGVVVRDSAGAAMTKFLLEDNFLTGAQISDGATIDLTDGDVVRHPVGVNVQTVGFDNNRVLNGVRYIDNGVPVNGASLFVPNAEASPIPQ